MSKEQKELLEEQLRWAKDQIAILDEMDSKLIEIKKVTEYAETMNFQQMRLKS